MYMGGGGDIVNRYKGQVYFLLEFEPFWTKAKLTIIYMTFTVLLHVNF